jgi:hypothetical protein
MKAVIILLLQSALVKCDSTTTLFNSVSLRESSLIATPSASTDISPFFISTSGVAGSLYINGHQVDPNTGASSVTTKIPIPTITSTKPIGSLTKTISLSDPTGIPTKAPLNETSSMQNNLSAAVNNLEIFADFLMGFVISLSLIGLIPPALKMWKNGVTKHLTLLIAFQILLIISHCLGIWCRYTYNTASLSLKAAISCLAIILSLWNRIYCIRMTELLVSSLRIFALYAYMGNLLLFLAVASPLFVWWLSINNEFEMVLNMNYSI